MNARARRRPPASEEGFALIEVVVSAAVLVIVVLGVLAAIDAVSSTASTNQSKTVASTLAQLGTSAPRSDEGAAYPGGAT